MRTCSLIGRMNREYSITSLDAGGRHLQTPVGKRDNYNVIKDALHTEWELSSLPILSWILGSELIWLCIWTLCWL